jgi:hypothetical protein
LRAQEVVLDKKKAEKKKIAMKMNEFAFARTDIIFDKVLDEKFDNIKIKLFSCLTIAIYILNHLLMEL